MAAEEQPPSEWSPPPILVKWRNYFAPGAEEQKPIVEMVQLAKTAGVIDQRKAVEAVAQIFGIENIDAYLETLQKEREENDQREADKATQQAELDAKTLHAAAGMKNGGGKPGAPGQQGGPKAPPQT